MSTNKNNIFAIDSTLSQMLYHASRLNGLCEDEDLTALSFATGRAIYKISNIIGDDLADQGFKLSTQALKKHRNI